jgi:PAS domain S-box-containing protein
MHTILYVDDEQDLLNLTKIFLERSGDFKVDTTTSVYEALGSLATNHYDAIVSDYQMPGMDGVEFLRRVRSESGDIPFILFTGRGREEVVIQAIDNGADFYLQKGGDPRAQFSELIHKIKQAIRRRRAETELLESERRFRGMAERSSDLIFVVDERHRMTYVSPSVKNITGFDPPEILGKTLDMSPILPDDFSKLGELPQIDAETDRTVRKMEIRVPKKDGSVAVLEARGSLVYTGTRFSGIQIQARDITRRKQFEEALRASEREYRTIFENTGTAMVIVENDGTFSLVNSEFERLSGYSKREIERKKKWTEFIAKEDLEWMLRQHKHRRDPSPEVRRLAKSHYDFSFIDRSGTVKNIHISIGIIPGTQRAVASLLDTTERTKLESGIRESEERYRSLIETTQTGYVIIDEEGRVIEANPEYVRLTGYDSLDNIRGRSVIEWTASGDRQKNLKAMGTCIEEGFVRNLEIGYTGPTGKVTPVEINANVIETGGSRRIISLCRDISDRKHAETELRATYEQLTAQEEELRAQLEELIRTQREIKDKDLTLQELMDTLPDIIYRADPQGKIQFINNKGLEAFGVTFDTIIGQQLTPYIHPDDLPAATRHYHTLLTTGKPVLNFECRFVAQGNDGRVFPVLQNLNVIRDQNGDIAGVQGIAMDISAMKHAEDALAESEIQLQLVAEQIPGSLWTTDASLRFTSSYGDGLADIGLSPNQIVGMTVEEFYHGQLAQDTAVIAHRRALGGNKVSYESQYNQRTLMVHIEPLRNAAGVITGTLGISFDITDRTRSEDALKLANRKMRLLSDITRHDIRNKLHALQGYLELSETISTNPGMNEFIGKMRKISETIRLQMDFTRDYQDLGILAPQWQSIEDLVAQVRSQLDFGAIDIAVDLEGLEIFADPLLEKVFYNLFDNAIKYGKTISRITISSTEVPEGLLILVEDDGIGIISRNKKKIFDRGFGTNTGFGLFLTREILSITGITIRENGKYREGARFEMIIPPGAYRIPSVA